ncbi:MAG: tetratricopeptide repeat protein [Spirochaetaceae bacterium]|jgi:tetratricopeptide (TPR) repeat protein|nr:tetratricopeptide repeat protein [Spirochaetaceae bacterium]
MKKQTKNGRAVGIAGFTICALLIAGGIFAANRSHVNKERRELAKRVAEYGPRKGVPREIEDLQKAIAAYEDLQKQHIKDAAQTGVYWKILAARFQDKGMYIEALKALEEGIKYSPADETLHYLCGLNASYSAKSMHDYRPEGASGPLASSYFATAEAAYLRAVELQPEYTQARYALAVLYIFELNKPQDAVQQLLRYMENRSGDEDSFFMLGRAYYMTGDLNEAVKWYGRGVDAAKDDAKKKEGLANKEYIESLIGNY